MPRPLTEESEKIILSEECRTPKEVLGEITQLGLQKEQENQFIDNNDFVECMHKGEENYINTYSNFNYDKNKFDLSRKFNRPAFISRI